MTGASNDIVASCSTLKDTKRKQDSEAYSTTTTLRMRPPPPHTPSSQAPAMRLRTDEWYCVANFLSTNEVYKLALSNKTIFFFAYFDDACKDRPLYRAIKRAMVRDISIQLAKREPAITLGRLFPEGLTTRDCEGRPQVLISGSVMVQAILGTEIWPDSDVDIFCTWKAAPMVRQRLMECGLVCSGANDSDDSDDSYRMPKLFGKTSPDRTSMVDHVEGYANWAAYLNSYNVMTGLFLSIDERDNLANLNDVERRDWWYNRALEFGKKAVARKFTRHQLSYGQINRIVYGPINRIGIPGGSLDGNFLYDRNAGLYETNAGLYGTSVQLIIGKEESQDARDLLRSFDFTICKTWYDGTGFGISKPHLSFTGQTLMTKEHYDLVNDYFQSERTLIENIEKLQDKSGIYSYSYEIPNLLEMMKDASWEQLGMSKIKATEEWHKPYEFIVKLIMRIQKYTERGIKIVNMPIGALECNANFLDRR